MPRQTLRGDTQLKIFANSRMPQIEPGIAQAVVEGIIFILEFPGGNCRRNSFQRLRIESHRLAHFTRSHAIAICDHVSGHGRSTLPITSINVLNYTLTLITARQIEINVGPLSAILGKKALKQ